MSDVVERHLRCLRDTQLPESDSGPSTAAFSNEGNAGFFQSPLHRMTNVVRDDGTTAVVALKPLDGGQRAARGRGELRL